MAAPDAREFDPPPDGLYGLREVARIFDLPESRLRYWSQTGFLVPSERVGGRPAYGFRDLVAIKVAKGLLDAGLPLRRVRRSLSALRSLLPRVDDPLARLRVRCEHDRVVVDDQQRSFEPETGQVLLDFSLANLRERVATVLELPGPDARSERGRAVGPDAWDLFLEARALECAWNGDPAAPQFTEALDRYRRALELDPSLAAAATNAGSMLAEIGDIDGARDLFMAALEHDPEQPEAQFNLAELALRQGDAALAARGFRQLLRLDPDYGEAHYGLARALIALGHKAQALQHLRRFCATVAQMRDEDRDDDLRERWACAQEAIEAIQTAHGERG